MRVTGGRWRGRRLPVVAVGRVRPTTDRLREALLAMLAERVVGARVVDLCCGTGSLGIEALSRGAASVELVDLSPAALRAAAANLRACGADPASYRLRRLDAARWLQRAVTAAAAATPWLVLADPPYGLGLAPRLASLLADLAAAGGLVVAAVEHAVAEPLDPACPVGWTWRERRHGATSIALLERLS